jgi:subtilisin family serine protease
MVAEVRSSRTNLTLQPGHAAYRSDIESAPLTASGVPEAYREAVRAVFAGDSVAYGEALAKVLTAGADTYWGKRAHDELYAPSSWMSLYSASSLIGVVVPMLQGLRNSTPAMPDVVEPMPEVIAP